MTKRRANGEGTMQLRKDGRWSVIFSAGRQDNGKLLRKTVYGVTQKEALEKAKQVRNQLDNGVCIDKRMRFGEWADDWHKGFRGSVSESTYEGYGYTLSAAKNCWGWR